MLSSSKYAVTAAAERLIAEIVAAVTSATSALVAIATSIAVLPPGAGSVAAPPEVLYQT
jgi:hypothetical protein